MIRKLRNLSDDVMCEISYNVCKHPPIERIEALAGELCSNRHDVSKFVEHNLKNDTPEEFKQLMMYMSNHNNFTVDDLKEFYAKRDYVKNLEIQDGLKYDADKPYSGLLADFAPALQEIAKVCTFGAKKYGVRNWKKVDNAEFRYHNAAWRHRLKAAGDIESRDKESKELHIAHEIWNLLAELTIHLEAKK